MLSKSATITIIILVILGTAGAGAIYWYSQKQLDETLSKNQSSLEKTTPKIPAEKPVSKNAAKPSASTNKEVTQAPVQTPSQDQATTSSSIKSCGTVNNSHLITTFGASRTADEISALKCIDLVISKCTPGSIVNNYDIGSATGQKGLFEVVAKDADNCNIHLVAAAPKVDKVCHIPQAIIDDMYKTEMSVDQPNIEGAMYIWLSFSLGLGNGWTDSTTGKQITIPCA